MNKLSDAEVFEHLNEKSDSALFWTLRHYFEQRRLTEVDYSIELSSDVPSVHAKIAVIKQILTN